MNEKVHEYLIVGAGVVGSSLAYELAKKSPDVVLLEKGEFTKGGSSAVPVALINPHRGRSARANASDKECVEKFLETLSDLEEKLDETGVVRSGIIRVAYSARQAKNWKRVSGAQALTAEEIPAEYHAPFGGIFVKDGCYLQSAKYLKALVSAYDLDLRANTEALSIEKSGENQLLKTNKGEILAKTVIFCTGAESWQRFNLPKAEKIVGDSAAFKTDVKMPYAMSGSVSGMSMDGYIQLGGNHRAPGEEDPEALEKLRRPFAWVIKDLQNAEVISVYSATRSKAADNKPYWALLEPNRYFLGHFGGRGFLCSSKLAKQLAEELTGAK